MVRQPGELEGGAEPAALAQPELVLQQQVEKVEVAHLLGLGPGHQLADGLAEVGQAEPGGVLPDPGGDQRAHRATGLTPAARA